MLYPRVKVEVLVDGEKKEGDLIDIVLGPSHIGAMGVISVPGERLFLSKITELREVFPAPRPRWEDPPVMIIREQCRPRPGKIMSNREFDEQYSQRPASACAAYTDADSMVCDRCRLTWDVGTETPSQCEVLRSAPSTGDSL